MKNVHWSRSHERKHFFASRVFTKQQQLLWWFLSTTSMGGYALAKA